MDQNSSVAESPELITTDFPCMFCQYNLRMLSRASNCPECGQPIALNPEPRPTAWVQSVYCGLFWFAVYIGGTIALMVLDVLLITYRYQLYYLYPFPGSLFTGLLPRLLLAITFIYAMWLITTPRPDAPTLSRTAKILRYLPVLMSLLMLVYNYGIYWFPLSEKINITMYLCNTFQFLAGILFYRLLWSHLITLPDARYPHLLGVNLQLLRTAHPLLLLVFLIFNDLFLNMFVLHYLGDPYFLYLYYLGMIIYGVIVCLSLWASMIFFLLLRRVHREAPISLFTILQRLFASLHNRALKFRALLTYHGTPPDPTSPSA